VPKLGHILGTWITMTTAARLLYRQMLDEVQASDKHGRYRSERTQHDDTNNEAISIAAVY